MARINADSHFRMEVTSCIIRSFFFIGKLKLTWSSYLAGLTQWLVAGLLFQPFLFFCKDFVARLGVDLVSGCVLLDRWRRKLLRLVFKLTARSCGF